MLEENSPRVFKETLAFTAFALEEFKARADRDGFQPAILIRTIWKAKKTGGSSCLTRWLRQRVSLSSISTTSFSVKAGSRKKRVDLMNLTGARPVTAGPRKRCSNI